MLFKQFKVNLTGSRLPFSSQLTIQQINRFEHLHIMKISRRYFRTSIISVLLLVTSVPAIANHLTDLRQDQDWPQWGGPNRNFSVYSPAENLRLPKPELVWTGQLGTGHSAIVAVGDFAYTLHLDGDHEVLKKWRVDSGEGVWSHRLKVGYHASSAQYDGPHATPTVLADQVIGVSIDAKAYSVDVESGELLWLRDLRTEFGTKLPQSGYACSPLVWQDFVLLPTLGDSQPAETETYVREPTIPAGQQPIPGAVALDVRSGKEVWRTKSFRSSHGSPILVEVSEQPMLVFHGMFELVGVDPATGKILWKQLLRRRAADNVSFTPIWDSERSQFLISHGYCDLGTQAISLKKTEAGWQTATEWTNSQLQIVHTNAVLAGHTLVGTKRPAATLMVAIDVRDGRTVFRNRGFSKSNLVTIGRQLLILDEKGDLVCGQLDDDGITEFWKIRALANPSWTVPSIVGKHLMLRDGREIKVYRFPIP